MVSTIGLVETKLGARNGKAGAGVRSVDTAGRRWYTDPFKRQIIESCLQPGASVSKIAVDNGLNPNLVRKWLARVRRDTEAQPELLPVVTVSTAACGEPATWRHVAEVQIGEAVILIGEHARAEVVRAIVQALR
jgi:transposase-like protein